MWRNDHCFAIRDAFPVSAGHTLVIPHRHVPTWFEATRAEQHALLDGVDAVRKMLEAEHPRPDGFTWGSEVSRGWDSTPARRPGRRSFTCMST